MNFIIADDRALKTQVLRSKSEPCPIIMAVKCSRAPEHPLVLGRAELGRHRPSRGGKLEPVIGFRSAVRVESSTSLWRFTQVTSNEFRVDVRKTRRQLEQELPGDVFRRGRRLAECGVILV